jgi:putative ABC transport system permease protein
VIVMLRSLRIWRVAIRLAARDARTSVTRTLLLVSLIAVPVAGSIGYAAVQVTSSPTPEAFATALLGAADARAETGVVDTAGAAASSQALSSARARVLPDLPRGTRMVLDVAERVRFRAEGRSIPGGLRLTDLADPVTRGLYRWAGGRAAGAGNEVVLSGELARRLGARLGSQVTWDADDRPRTVVGLVDDRQDTAALVAVALADDAAVDSAFALAARTSAPTLSVGWLVTSPEPSRALQSLSAAGFSLTSRADLELLAAHGAAARSPRNVALGIAGLTLIEAGLLIGAALTIVARRRQRELGLLSAAGADAAMRRRVMTASGVQLGLLGGAAAAPLGWAIAAVLAGPLSAAAHQDWGSLRVDPLVTAVAPVLGAVTAVVASYAAGRRVAALTPMEALRGGRTARHRQRRGQVAVLGAVGGLGVLLLGYGGWWGSPASVAVGSVVSLAVLALGVTRILPGTRDALSRWPFPLRAAVRDAAEHSGRSAALATSVATLFVVTIVATTYLGGLATRAAQDYVPSAPPGTAVFRGQSPVTSQAVALAGQALNASTVARFTLAGMPTGAAVGLGSIQATVANPLLACIESHDPPRSSDIEVCARSVGMTDPFPQVGIADSGLVEAVLSTRLTAPDRAVLDAGSALVLDPRLVAPNGTVSVRMLGRFTSTGGAPVAAAQAPIVLPARAVTAGRGPRTYLQLPAVVVTSRTAERAGLLPTASYGIYFGTGAPPQSAAEDRARALLETADGSGELTVERGASGERLLRQILLVVMLALGLTTLVIVGISVALSTNEMRRDLATLAAVGAATRTRRRLTGAQALLLSCLGVGMGLLVGYGTSFALLAANGLPRALASWGAIGAAGLAACLTAAAVGAAAAPVRLTLVRRSS